MPELTENDLERKIMERVSQVIPPPPTNEQERVETEKEQAIKLAMLQVHKYPMIFHRSQTTFRKEMYYIMNVIGSTLGDSSLEMVKQIRNRIYQIMNKIYHEDGGTGSLFPGTNDSRIDYIARDAEMQKLFAEAARRLCSLLEFGDQSVLPEFPVVGEKTAPIKREGALVV